MKRFFGIAFMIIGVALIVASIGMLIYNTQEENQAEENAQNYLSKIISLIPDENTSSSSNHSSEGAQDTSVDTSLDINTDESQDAPHDENIVSEMKVVEIDGYSFVGYVSIPALNITLPVMSETQMTLLKISPCRLAGSPKTDNLVIGAHNYRSHFGKLSTLTKGDAVVFTDMEGNVWKYKVVFTETLQPNDAEYLTAGEYPLTLYTCVYGGGSRVTVRCERDLA